MIDEYITHLQGAGLTPEVRYALTTEPVESYDDELPVIMVYPVADAANSSVADNRVVQNVTSTVACLLGCKVSDYETLRDELRAASLGWVTGNYDAMELASGNIEGILGEYIWWREVYAVRVRIQETT